MQAPKADAENDGEVVIEYENVTDTIKRRLESPVNTPETEKPELKRSKIPLARKSPAPIKKEIKEGGNRSRGSSLERPKKKADSPMSSSMTSDSICSLMSVDSIEVSASVAGSVPSTPEVAKKDSSTFNLLKDSDLFTQISNDQVGTQEPEPRSDSKDDSCHVVEVKEREIVKSTVSPIELKEIYPSEAVETVVEFIPQTVERVEIIDDTEGESVYDSDNEEEESEAADLGSEPTTFVVEVQEAEQRKPTVGVLKRRDGAAPAESASSEDVSMHTPPPSPGEPSEGEGEAADREAIYAEVGDAPQVRSTARAYFTVT